MRLPTENFEDLVDLLQCTSKKQLIRHAAKITIYSQDYFALILGAQHGAFLPYRYANHFDRSIPADSIPNDEDHKALAANGIGVLSKQAKKFSNKIFHAFTHQRYLAAHLLYTPNFKYWHLFFSDNRDREKHRNHWREGPHLHYTSDFFGLDLNNVWSNTLKCDTNFAKLHIRYCDERE